MSSAGGMLGLDESSVKAGPYMTELTVDFMRLSTSKGSRPDTCECHRKEDGDDYTGEMKNAGPPCHLAMGADRRLVGSELL
jgi:hypothetical protein